ncbi:MAG: recombinase RecA [Clostridiales bacterium]|jgi:recombination protein RecA|nr:recombinase RecA [Clostridiales bacterium]
MTIQDERKKALSTALAKIEKDFGKGSVMKMGEKVAGLKVDFIPSGSLGLDIALGIGGYPRGRIIEIYGPESSGKTTVALHLIAEAQKMGGIVAFIDAEHALDPVYAKKLGVDIDELYISQPDNGEQALDIADEMIRSGAIDVIVIDSVAALVPKAEIEGDMGDSHMGLHARLMSQALRKMTALANKNNCIILFTNQLREKIGAYGNPETTTGGRALKFYASVRLDIRRISKSEIKQGDDILGFRAKVKVVKNKVAPPFKVCEFDIIFGKGIAKGSDILDLAVDCGIVAKSGSWFSYGDMRLGQGREKVNQYLLENPDLKDEIELAVRDHHGVVGNPTKLNEEPIPEPAPAKKSAKKGKKKDDDIVAELSLDDDEIDSIMSEMGFEGEPEE